MKLRKTGIIEIYPLVFLFAFCCILCQVSAFAGVDQELREYIEYSKKYSFSSDWFSGHIPVWENILAQFKNKPNIRYLEVGVFEGRSLIWILENILTDPNAKATCIDIFPEGIEESLRGNLRISGFSKKVKIIKGESQFELKKLPPHSFDLIYIDASHAAADVLSDAVLSWPLLKNDGLLIFDDYIGEQNLPEELKPQIAVDAFINSYRYFVEVVYRGSQVILKKVNNTFSLGNNSNCSPVGQYVYSWNEKKLYHFGTNEAIELSDAERDLLERVIKSKKLGEFGFVYDGAILKDEVFVNLKKRLSLDLGQSNENR